MDVLMNNSNFNSSRSIFYITISLKIVGGNMNNEIKTFHYKFHEKMLKGLKIPIVFQMNVRYECQASVLLPNENSRCSPQVATTVYSVGKKGHVGFLDHRHLRIYSLVTPFKSLFLMFISCVSSIQSCNFEMRKS